MLTPALHHVSASLVQNRLSIPINKKMKEMQAPTTQPNKGNNSKDSKCLIPGRAQSTAGEDILKAASIECCLKCSLITFLYLMCRSTFLFCYCYAREFWKFEMTGERALLKAERQNEVEVDCWESLSHKKEYNIWELWGCIVWFCLTWQSLQQMCLADLFIIWFTQDTMWFLSLWAIHVLH